MPAVTTDPRTRLSTLLREHALVRESVMLSSGRRSSYYFDARQVLLDPEGAALSGELMWRALAPAAPRAVGGLPLGADPLVCAVSATAWAAGERVTGFFVRKEAKKHGLQQWIEGPFIEEGTPVAVVDDVLTSGGSLVVAVEKARQAGGVVVAAAVVVDRGEGGRETAEEALAGAPLHALFTAAELLETGRPGT
jgi:orotate phosphoribosyltransferase